MSWCSHWRGLATRPSSRHRRPVRRPVGWSTHSGRSPEAADLKLATVNVTDGALAQAATLLALEAAATEAGEYGLVDGDVVLPPGL